MKMSSTHSGRNKAIVAGAAVGAGVLLGVAGYFLYSSLVEKKKVQKLQEHLARESISSKNSSKSSSNRSRRNSLSSYRSEYDTADEMFSALNTDNEEFYDLNSEEEDEETRKDSEIFEEVDILMKGGDQDRLKAFNLLRKYELKMSENPDFWWRYAKANQMQAVVSGALKDMEAKKKYVYEGLEHATKALALDSTNPDVNKWFAILTGMQADFVSIKEKIQNAYVFQKHILVAIESKPEDYSLHHLLGRFKFEVANTSWIEKKLASSLFAEIPDFTYSDAVTDLLEAENLNPVPWKENRLLLARCYIGDGKYDKAIEWLDSAGKITPNTKEDEACDEEVNVLMEKYNKYRK